MHSIKCGPMVVLIVGAEEVRMTCHKILLTYHSSFFDKAFNGSFVEGQNNEIKFPEDSAEDMHAFFSWLYSGRLEI
jgi:hypothetical protein